VGLSAIFTASAFARFGSTTRAWSLLPLLFALAFIAVSDLRLHIIPDKITLPSTIYVLGLALFLSPSAFGHALLGAAIGGTTILLLAIVTRGGIGGGDVKLMVLSGGALGWQASLTVFLVCQVLALAAAVILSIARRRIFRGSLPVGAIIAGLTAIALLTRAI
jgi:leader peptidase (prepilin peptidase)/N-methyltransferase